MKLFERIFAIKLLPNSVVFFLAFFCAVGMYYYVGMREMLETQIELNLDYTGIPPDLIITSGLENSVKVRLRGPETLIRSIPRDLRSETVDLSGIKKGDNVVPMILPETSAKFRAYDIIDIIPTNLTIKADTILNRTVPVRVVPQSPMGTNVVTIGNQSLSSSTVTLRGPESIVSGISHVEAFIHPNSQEVGKPIEQTVTIGTPSLVVATPSTVRVQYTITSGRTVISRNCKIKIKGSESQNYSISPSSINILVEVPEGLAKDEKYLSQLQAVVDAPHMEIGEHAKVKLRINLPEGMKQTNPGIDEVTITRLDK